MFSQSVFRSIRPIMKMNQVARMGAKKMKWEQRRWTVAIRKREIWVFRNQTIFFSARQNCGNSIILSFVESMKNTFEQPYEVVKVDCDAQWQLIDFQEFFYKRHVHQIIVFHFKWIIYQNSRHSFANNFENIHRQTFENEIGYISIWFLGQATICCEHFHVTESQLYSISSKNIPMLNTIANVHFMSSCKNYKKCFASWDKSQSKQIFRFLFLVCLGWSYAATSATIRVHTIGDGTKLSGTI